MIFFGVVVDKQVQWQPTRGNREIYQVETEGKKSIDQAGKEASMQANSLFDKVNKGNNMM